MTAYLFHIFDTTFSPPRTTRPLSPKPSARPGTWQAAAQKNPMDGWKLFFKDPSWFFGYVVSGYKCPGG